MKRALLACLTVLLVSGAVYGTTYTWINTSAAGVGLGGALRDWDNVSNWDLGAVPGLGDAVIVSNGGAFTATHNIVVGEMRIGNGSRFNIGAFTLTTVENSTIGTTGNFFYRNTAMPTCGST